MKFKREYQWHAVYVKSRAEKKVDKELNFKRIKTYLPLVAVKKQWSDRVKVVEEPLLRGYLFVQVSNKEYVDVLQTSGAVSYVMFSGKAATIPDKQIQALKLFVEKANSKIHVTSETIQKGQQVKVIAGVLAGMEGEITEVRGTKRIVLRFENLGCSVFADVSMELVERVDAVG
ncbi:MAG TPA: UpxY family transcription antiterminator [Sunxiuqinia sp.]|nr:UpxY family transcription antiterminator [Sunxiuqinia sp.]